LTTTLWRYKQYKAAATFREKGYDDEVFAENFHDGVYISSLSFLSIILFAFKLKSSNFYSPLKMAAPELPASLKKSLENSKAEYVRLGKSGLKISVPIMGAMSLGPKHWAPWLIEEAEVRKVRIKRAVTDT
jgi:hypothetical protein